MIDELTWDDNYVPDRGKILSPEDLAGMDKFYRYLDTDGDHIPYRTLPGTDPKGAYFTRGSGHNKHGGYTEDGAEYKEVVDRLKSKWESAADKVPAPIINTASKPAQGKVKFAIISIGSCDGAVVEARDKLETEGVYLNYMRVRGFPFSGTVKDFIDEHDQIFVIEQNRDAQLHGFLLGELDVPREKLIPVLHYSGEPLDYKFVHNALSEELKTRKQVA